jgi:hypothetical protein
MKAHTIKTIERNFPNQWILLEVTATKDGTPFKGVVLKVSKKRQDIVQASAHINAKNCFSFLAGFPHRPIPPSPSSYFSETLDPI